MGGRGRGRGLKKSISRILKRFMHGGSGRVVVKGDNEREDKGQDFETDFRKRVNQRRAGFVPLLCVQVTSYRSCHSIRSPEKFSGFTSHS